MCGIVGIYYKKKLFEDGIAPEKHLNNMLESISYRGDGEKGYKQYNKCGLGMVRLPIIDLATHKIPYENETNEIAVVHNGEIYNYQEIKKNLKQQHIYKTACDSEVILHSFEEKGIECVDDFNGMFSISIYDTKEDELFLVRDRCGEKFLYYYEDEEKVVFGSEIKAILQVIEPKETHCFSYEMFEACFGEETLFKGIKLLEPGSYIKFSGSNKKEVRYWNLLENLIEIDDDPVKIEKDLTDLIVQSIETRLSVGTYPLGVLVSGGIDSGLIAAIAKPDLLYTSTYEGYGSEFSELEYAQKISRHINKDLKIVKPTKEAFNEYRETVAFHLDTPCTWSSFNLFNIFKTVAQDTKIVATGEGMDEMFGGYHRYHLLYHDMQIYQLDAMDNYDYLIGKYYGEPFSRYIKLINRSNKIEEKKYNDYMENLVKPYFDFFKNDVVHAMGAVDFFSSMQIILQMADRMSMAHTLEDRAPFLDHRLVQYAYSMPEKYKINNGTTKYLIKKIAGKFLPKDVVERKDKRGFLLPFNMWFPSQGNKYDRSSYRDMAYNDWRKVFFNER